eukprot:Hpha_TRINITY_DN18438_c0_g1::TRINITY_DN18438_c0_g1_i1::g.165351::m.165351
MPVQVDVTVKEGMRPENKVFGHYKGIKEEMEKVDAGKLSCSQIYEMECERLKVRPNPRMMDQMPKTPGSYTVHELNAVSNYLGDVGVTALLGVIEVNKALRKIKLSENGIRSETAKALVTVLRGCHNVISLDLSGNKHLALDVGTCCLSLTKENQNMMHLSLNKTSVSRSLQENIEKQLRINRKKNGENNRKLLQERKRLERHQFFEMKHTYDALDFDKSGSVSIKDLHDAEQKKIYNGKTKDLNMGAQAALFEQLDKNGDGEVTLLEYISAAFPSITREEILHCIDCFSEFAYPDYVPPPELSLEQIEEISAIFRVYDKNADGRLTLAELKGGLSKSAMCIDVEKYFGEADHSADGALELPEFINMMTEYYIG